MKGSYEVEELKGFYVESLVVKEPYPTYLISTKLEFRTAFKRSETMNLYV